jgi:hypothetical protein
LGSVGIGPGGLLRGVVLRLYYGGAMTKREVRGQSYMGLFFSSSVFASHDPSRDVTLMTHFSYVGA